METSSDAIFRLQNLQGVTRKNRVNDTNFGHSLEVGSLNKKIPNRALFSPQCPLPAIGHALSVDNPAASKSAVSSEIAPDEGFIGREFLSWPDQIFSCMLYKFA